jgi:AraC-like DNA-binding protein
MPRKSSAFTMHGQAGDISLASYQHGSLPFVIHTFHEHLGTMPEHTHNFVELVYLRRGSAVHVHAGRKYPVYAGDCFVVAQGQAHAFEQGRDLALTNVLFRQSMIDRFDRELLRSSGFVGFFSIEPLFRDESKFARKLHLAPPQQRTCVRFLDNLEEEFHGRKVGYRAACRALLMQLVVLLSRCFEGALGDGAARQEFEGKRRVVADAVAYMEHHVGNRVRVADVAAAAFVSPSTLAHTFKSQTGMSLVEYVTRMRIDLAMQMLAQTDRSITDVALSSGFHDAAYFCRIFRNATGQTPKGYRRSRR